MLTCWTMEYVCITSFFNFYTNLAESSFVSFSRRIVNIFIYDICFFSANNFAHAQTLYRVRSLCRSSMVIWSYSWIYEYYAGKIECFTGCKIIKCSATYFLRSRLFTYGMILWKISTAISINIEFWQLLL
jgi:hypothetical protein